MLEKKDKSATINLRIDEPTKKLAAQAFANMGMDLSTGIKVYLRQVALDQAMPFTPDASPDIEALTNRAEEDVKAGRVKMFDSLEEFRKDLHRDED